VARAVSCDQLICRLGRLPNLRSLTIDNRRRSDGYWEPLLLDELTLLMDVLAALQELIADGVQIHIGPEEHSLV
jgi:hypothetical protein